MEGYGAIVRQTILISAKNGGGYVVTAEAVDKAWPTFKEEFTAKLRQATMDDAAFMGRGASGPSARRRGAWSRLAAGRI
jgi:hypothetical protein